MKQETKPSEIIILKNVQNAITVKNGQMLSTVLIGNLSKVFAAITQSYCRMDQQVTDNNDAWTSLHIVQKDWLKLDIKS